MVILNVQLFKETVYGKNRPLDQPESILFYSANSKGIAIEILSFFYWEMWKDF